MTRKHGAGWKWAVMGVATAVLLAGCSSGDDAAAPDAEKTGTVAVADDPEGCDGSVEAPDPRFVVDDCGRVVILRGVNVESSAKGATQDDEHLPSTAVEDQAALGTWGWNGVRFLVFWGAIEPEDGTYDEAYLDEVETWLDWYADHDVHVVLDLHQDIYAWKVFGNGAPDWAVDTKGLESKPLPEGQPWVLQAIDPAVQAAYQSFWNPEPGERDLRVDYHEALAHLAERFADHPAVIGYDVMNEPSFAHGDLEATLAIQDQAAAGEFENPNLTAFMQDGIEAVRSADEDAWVMVEPTSLLNAFPYAGDLVPDGLDDPRDGPPRLAYAGHLYQTTVHDGTGYPEGDTYLEQWEALRVAEAEEMDAALWFGEWGGPPDQDGMDRYVAEVLTMADRTMTGWAWWSWDPGGWSPVETDGSTVSDNGRRLMRVQPRAVAGTPTAFSWDDEAWVFTMSWDERDDASGPTELAVPASLFPDGFVVVLDGEAVVDPAWIEQTSILRLDPDRSRSTHEVCIAEADDPSCES